MKTRSLIVIPAYNEEPSIARVIKGCLRYCDVLVVDDGSYDETSRLSKEAGAIVFSNPCNKGYEYALNIGYRYALEQEYDVMITMDADGQLPSESVPQFLSALSGGACLVVGRRKVRPRFCEKALAFFSARFSTLLDPYCGMKAYDLTAMKKNCFSTYNSVGTSLALDYIEQDFRCENIDIDIQEREGQSKFGGILVSEFRLLRSMLIGHYRLVKHRIKWTGAKHNDV